MRVIWYEVVAPGLTTSPGELRDTLVASAAAVGVEHCYWVRTALGWQGLVFVRAADGDSDPAEVARHDAAVEAAFTDLSTHGVVTVVRADLPR
ncbi:hypothetical protein [Intrasporangium sp.]|uniref:hypothetical protein n=1 Tax=Intrasporangium sp. TaxID=1925024 RepID=UPI0032220193